ncbi:hypothetical protein NEISICOT_00837 [Neisseria sicca ATCC 29256]|uniref:Uncharacterized protein n=1 Tax=Neisseria sicca ATCC 29256 TaxID=547045 RepID=C6M2U8_NEISI|nr:hypothetical protein NEISICOT_00837 [Neisseria sicca ATCC 29256]
MRKAHASSQTIPIDKISDGSALIDLFQILKNIGFKILISNHDIPANNKKVV